MTQSKDVLVLGLGNLLMGDDGVGVHVVKSLTNGDRPLPSGVRVVDGGTLGLDLLPLLADARALVIVDAVDLGSAPGSIRVLRGDELDGGLISHVSPHEVGLRDLLAVGRLTGSMPDHVALVGVQPSRIEVGLELTDACLSVLPDVVAVVRAEVDALYAAAGAD